MTRTRMIMLGAVAIIAIIALIIHSERTSRWREARDRELFPYLLERPPVTKYKSTAEALEAKMTAAEKLERACVAIRSGTRDKRVGDLTVREAELLHTCRALGF